MFSSKKRFCLRDSKCFCTSGKKTTTKKHMYLVAVTDRCVPQTQCPHRCARTDPRKLQVANVSLCLYPQCDHVVKSEINTGKYFLLAIFNPSQSDPSFTNLQMLVYVGGRLLFFMLRGCQVIFAPIVAPEEINLTQPWTPALLMKSQHKSRLKDP